MELFGKVGIDWRLLIAQAVNFAVLVWFLDRFVYKPLLKGMESGELEHAEREMEKVRAEKERVARERDAAIREAKKRSAEVVEEAEKIAERLRERVQAEALTEKEEILAQAREQSRLQKGAADEALSREARTAIADGLLERWRDRLTADAAAALQGAYLDALVADLAALPADAFGAAPGSARLEYAVAPAKGQKERLAKALADKAGVKDVALEGKKAPGLLAGFRLEAAGVVVDENLLTDIRHAVKDERQ